MAILAPRESKEKGKANIQTQFREALISILRKKFMGTIASGPSIKFPQKEPSAPQQVSDFIPWEIPSSPHITFLPHTILREVCEELSRHMQPSCSAKAYSPTLGQREISTRGKHHTHSHPPLHLPERFMSPFPQKESSGSCCVLGYHPLCQQIFFIAASAVFHGWISSQSLLGIH